jgi:putative protease
MVKKLVGKVTHWFPNIGVAVVRLDSDLKLGDRVSFEGMETDLQQAVKSMQINKTVVTEARAGTEVAVKVEGRVREGDHVYLESV